MKFAGKWQRFTLSEPTEGVKLSGAAIGGATVNGSTLWRHPLGGGRRCNVLFVRISQATGRRRCWTDILKIIFLIPCTGLHICSVYGVFYFNSRKDC